MEGEFIEIMSPHRFQQLMIFCNSKHKWITEKCRETLKKKFELLKRKDQKHSRQQPEMMTHKWVLNVSSEVLSDELE